MSPSDRDSASRDFSLRDLQAVLDHFPDGVDVAMVDRPLWMEIVLDPVDFISFVKSAVNPQDLEAATIKTNLILDEIEPETGIYACMSPVTHRVYVFISEAYG